MQNAHPETDHGARPATRAVVRSRTNGKACITCHSRKVKCDILVKGSPCSNCHTQGTPGCRLYERRSSRRSAHQTRGSSQQSPAAVPSDLTPEDRIPSTASSPLPGAVRKTRAALSGHAAADTDGEISVQASPQHAAAAASSRKKHDALNEDDEPETSHLSEFLSHDEARVSEISYRNRLYFIGTEFSTLNHLVRQRTRPEDHAVLHFGSRTNAPRLPQVPADCLRLPGKRLSRELIDAYFSLVNRGFQIVHQETFMNSYDTHGRTSPLSLMLLNAMFFAASHALEQSRPELRRLTPQFFRRARQLFDARHDADREHYIQAALLFTWCCDRLEDVVSNSWHWVGVASRSAFGLGLHRDASSSRITTSIKRHWVRLWWTIYQFDVMTSAAHGRPQSIDLDQSDVAELEASHFIGAEDSADFAIHHTRICLILSKAMKSISALKGNADDKEAARRKADKDLALVFASLPRSLQTFSYETADVWVCTLHLSYHYTLLLLHRPPPIQGQREVTSEDVRICSDSASAITSIFDSLRRRRMLGSLWIPCAYVLFATLVYVSTQLQSASPIVAASSQRLYSQLMEALEALTDKWLFAQSLLLVFQKGLSQNRSMPLGKPSPIEASIEGELASGGPSAGGRTIGASQAVNGRLIDVNQSPQSWSTHESASTMASFAGTSLDFSPHSLMGADYSLSDALPNMQYDFDLFLAGIGTGESYDFREVYS
ncbi:fungal specific transcription factor domain-containing protein [Sarocladium implicatum]|nr:fungal specific transcription factor domain-containing protein [Sarocladium implicatum]